MRSTLVVMPLGAFFARIGAWFRPRRVWWILLTASVLILVATRSDTIGAHDPTFLDKGALGLLALLLLLPLFREVEGFGFRFKQWEQFKREVREDIRQEVRLAASAQATNTTIIGGYTEAQLQRLLRLKPDVEAEIAAELPEVKVQAALQDEPTVPDSAKEVFALTYPVAKELALLWRQVSRGSTFPPPPPNMVAELASEGIISEPVEQLLRPLIWMDNVVRTGQDVTSGDVEYVRQTAPEIQRWLHARRLALKRGAS